MSDCIFCKIIKGDIPSARVYEDDKVLAFLDIQPANKGHVLVIPKEHYETLTDLPDVELAILTKDVKAIVKAVTKATEAEGYNIIMNNKSIAGQIVAHAHFHIIPRFKDDGLDIKWPSKKYEDDEMDSLKEKIRTFL